MKRRAVFVSISGEDNDDEDIPTSYCPKCLSYGFNSLMGERIYKLHEPKASDHDLWMSCPRCGLLIAKPHVKRETKTIGFTEPDESIHDSSKVVIKPIHERSKKYDITREAIKRIDSNKNSTIKSDKDLQLALAKGKKLISYSDSSS